MATISQIKASFQSGTALNGVLIGTSVGVGYRATYSWVGSDGLSPKLQANGKLQTSYQKAILYGLDGTSQILSWGQQFRNALKAKNSLSVFDNQSGNGWHIRSHINAGTPAYVLGLNPLPDFVMIGTTINDFNNLSWASFTSDQSSVVSSFLSAEIPVILIKENDINTAGHGAGGGTYDAFGDYADTLATNFGAIYPGMITVLDFRTPTRSAILSNGGYTADAVIQNGNYIALDPANYTSRVMYDDFHPAQRGHDLMAATALSFFQDPLIFATQPSITSTTDDGGIIAYGTADPAADDVTASASSSATVTATATLREASAALVTAGVSAASVSLMVEAVTATARSATVVTDTLQSVETAIAQIAAFPSVSDLLTLAQVVTAQFAYSAQPVLASSTADGGVISYGTYDTGFDDVASSADVTAAIQDVVTRIEHVLITAQAVPSVADLLAQVESITTTVQADATAVDVKLAGVADSLLSAADAVTQVADLQLLVDNVTTMAQSGASMEEVAAYVDQATTAATVGASVMDALLGTFIGQYVFLNTCPPRIFSNTAPPRTYINYCSPRGTA